MKQSLLLLLLLGLASSSFCQATDSISGLKRSYMRKSRFDNIAGTTLFIGGMVTFIAGAYNALGDGIGNAFGQYPEHPNAPVAEMVIGAASFGTGLIMYSYGYRNRVKATSLSFGMQSAPSLLPGGQVGTCFQPAITFHLGLSKRKRAG